MEQLYQSVASVCHVHNPWMLEPPSLFLLAYGKKIANPFTSPNGEVQKYVDENGILGKSANVERNMCWLE